MSSAELDNLVRIGKLKREPPSAHALSLYALRRLGYRSDNRYLVFQVLPQSAGLPPEVWRVLAKAHDRRNLAEYEGHLEHDDQLLADVLAAAERLRITVEALPQKIS